MPTTHAAMTVYTATLSRPLFALFSVEEFYHKSSPLSFDAAGFLHLYGGKL